MKKIFLILFCLCMTSIMSAQTLQEIKYESDSVSYDSIFDSNQYYKLFEDGEYQIVYNVPLSLEKYHHSGEVCIPIGAVSLSLGIITSAVGLSYWIHARNIQNSGGPTKDVYRYYQLADIHFIAGGAFITIGIPITVVGAERKKTADIIYNNILW